LQIFLRMPIAHIVLFKFKPTATPEQIEKALKDAPKLLSPIEGVLEIIGGENFTQRSKGYTHGLIVRFIDKGALEKYAPHPIHQQYIKEILDPIREDTLAFDFEY